MAVGSLEPYGAPSGGFHDRSMAAPLIQDVLRLGVVTGQDLMTKKLQRDYRKSPQDRHCVHSAVHSPRRCNVEGSLVWTSQLGGSSQSFTSRKGRMQILATGRCNPVMSLGELCAIVPLAMRL